MTHRTHVDPFDGLASGIPMQLILYLGVDTAENNSYLVYKILCIEKDARHTILYIYR